jgi:PhnB protein
MSEVSLTEQLDRAIHAILINPDDAAQSVDQQIGALLSLAVDLQHLPRGEFRAQLRSIIEREAAMSAATEKQQSDQSPRKTGPPREGFRTVTPYLTVSDIHREIKFLTEVFGATGRIYGLGSAGGFHSEYKIGESMIMLGGGGEGATWRGVPQPSALHVYVEDVDAVYQRAVDTGATSLMPPTDMEYGERGAGIEDVGGNHWYIATASGPTYKPEGLPNLMPYFNPRGAFKMVEFLKQAFAAEPVTIHQSPDGIVHHAKIKIGDSIVEMGEAHGQWQPRPMTFMLYVEDCDAWYERAMKAAGAVSISPPANAPYGGRTGVIKDPFENTWYISTP